MYELIFDKKALNDLRKIENKIKERIWNKLVQCKQEPFRFLIPLKEFNAYKLRVGNYRVIVDIQKEIKILSVLRIGHRKHIYNLFRRK